MPEITDSGLGGYGFSKEAKRNLVIAIMTIQFSAIGYMQHDNSCLHKEIEQIRTAQADSATAMYNRLLGQVAIKMSTLQGGVGELQSTVATHDSLNRELNKRK
jgi:hypothetical protein